jgi:hypothetical protein
MDLFLKNNETQYSYTFVDDGININRNSDGSIENYTIQYENIGFDEYILHNRPNKYRVILMVSLLFNVLSILVFINSVIALGSLNIVVVLILFGILGSFSFKIVKTNHQKYISGNQVIIFPYDTENSSEVNKFIDIIKTKRKEYYRKTYMKVDDTTPADNLRQVFTSLLKEKYINQDELEMLQELLDHRKLIKGF